MRALTGFTGKAIAAWAAAAAVFHLYTAYIGFLEPREQRSLHLLWLMPLIFLLYPASKKFSPQHRPSVFDWMLSALAIAPNVYSYVEANRINMRLEDVDPVAPIEVVLGTIVTVLVFEGLRRAVTPVLAGIMGGVIVYLFATEYLPGMLYYRDIPLPDIAETMFLFNGQGVYGAITGMSATLVAIFIAFGAVVEGTGVGRLFNNLGSRAAGRYSGGPAKVAVLTSALFGTMSGSSASNVFTTGSFTIPMMKRLGYRPQFAGGVEAAASVGGQIMPPIMGAGAFIMSEFTNIPYNQIAISAAIGACCYFFMVGVTVHLEAKKHGLRGMNEDELPSWRSVLHDLHLVIPILVLMGLLVAQYSAHFAALYSLVTAFVVAQLRRHTRLGPRAVFNILANAGRNIASIAVACVGAAVIVAALTKTGLIISLGTIITSMSGGMLWAATGLLMLLTLLMGMGIPTTAAYVITSAIGAPTLISEFGVPVLAAHMFIFYFAILADATPPVCIASYAAAGIAKADPMLTGIQASRLAIAGYILGVSYVYTPALLMQGPVLEVIGQVLVNLIGLSILSVGVTGYLNAPVAWIFRPLLMVGGLGIALLENFQVWPRVGLGVIMLAAVYYLPGVFSLGRSRPPAVPAPVAPVPDGGRPTG